MEEPHDGLQHDHRVRRARRHGRADRDEFRWVRDGGRGRPRVDATLHRGRRHVRPRDHRRRRPPPDGQLGTNPAQVAPVRRRARPGPTATSAPCTTWASRPGRRCRRSASTACSSARAPTADRRPARRGRHDSRQEGPPAGAGHGRAWLAPGQSRGRAGRPRSRLRRRRIRMARGWLHDVPGHEPGHLEPGERCASTSNRNFEGRQGKGGRTHLVSPPMAAAAAIAGHFVDVRELELKRHGSIHQTHGPGRSAGPRRRRYRPDHPQAVPEEHQSHGVRRGLFFDWRFRPDGSPVPDFVTCRNSRARASWSAAATSGLGRRASTRPGRCSSLVFAR